MTPELVRAYLERLQVHGEDDAYYGLTARLRPAEGDIELERLALPALVVWGAEDRLIRVEAGRRAARRLPEGELVTIPRCGHLPMEERPAELLGLMAPFLRRHGETAASTGAGASPVVPRGGG